MAVVASNDGRTLYVANFDARQIAVVDVDSGRVSRTVDLPAPPSGLALTPDGRQLIVACAAPRSTLAVVDVASAKIEATLPAGHTASAVAVSPDGKRAYVCNRFDHDVSVIDLAARKTIARVDAVREPIAVAVSPDGRSIVVANHLPADPANRFYVSCEVTIVDAATHETTSIRLPNGSSGLRGLCIAADGRLAFATHILSNYELVPAQLDMGWANTNVVSIIDVVEKKLINTIGLDDPYLGAANPWGVACTDDGRTLCVAHAGTGELSLVDLPALLKKIQRDGPDGKPVYASPRTGGTPNDPGLMVGLRRRVELPGVGPRDVCLSNGKVFVTEYFSDTLAVVDLGDSALAGSGAEAKSIALGPKPQWTQQRRGEMLFNDARICYQMWHSCATCHPDARADVLNWDLRNDGVGNPKNTKSMLAAHETPPAMAVGVRATAEVAVRSGIEHILFSQRPESEAEAIDAYLRSLEAVPSPRLVDGRLSPAAQRGKRLFSSDRVGCHHCHPAPLYTDRAMHDVGTRGPYDESSRFDTPTLLETWRTGPYLHDGRYTTIRQLLVEGRHGLDRGRLERLSEQEIADLVEFVESL